MSLRSHGNLSYFGNKTVNRVGKIERRRKTSFLIIHKDEDLLKQAKNYLKTIDGIDAYTASNPEEIFPLITTCFYDLIILIASEDDSHYRVGVKELKELRYRGVSTPLIILHSIIDLYDYISGKKESRTKRAEQGTS
ncbi:MAG: hypothetical protein ACFFD4_21150 [Candidatus Odinarchaeota archaeon]